MEYQDRKRVGVFIEGRVQGVGFRPCVFRLASQNDLSGFVANSTDGVYIEAEGLSSGIKSFLDGIKYKPPPQSAIKRISVSFLPVQHDSGFRIEKSRFSARAKTEISPDIATCPECLNELFDRSNRRYLYPFINCTNCGPRFTIVNSLPYDRKNTTMRRFMMCPDCYAEYVNPTDRRFHAQPDCCCVCGPEYSLWQDKRILSKGEDSIKSAAGLLGRGAIVAVKGTGGYHIVCLAYDGSILKKLRERKNRGDKPFALMSKDIDTIQKHCIVNQREQVLLSSWRTPIVILRKRKSSVLPEEVAPLNQYIGFFLPYTPAHHLLFYFGGFDAIVATSGNMADEPIAYADKDAFQRLAGLADYILTNNRDIHMGADDSVVKSVPQARKGLYVIRKARGFTPEPLKVGFCFKKQVLGTGSNEKNTFSLGRGGSIIMSQYTGSLASLESIKFYRDAYENFRQVFDFSPGLIACDLHPDYVSTRFARELAEKEKLPLVAVQHHHAHAVSCMADNFLPNCEVIGVVFDGTGMGDDMKIWGAEFMLADYTKYSRLAHLKYVGLPGGEIAIKKDVWRTGLSYLYQIFGQKLAVDDFAFLQDVDKEKAAGVLDMLAKGINCPDASSMGRLFDAVSAIAGIRNNINYDSQAAIELEMAAVRSKDCFSYRFSFLQGEDGCIIIDPINLIEDILFDLKEGISTGIISYRFHSSVALMVRDVCVMLRESTRVNDVVLSGGVFQNTLLLTETYKYLRSAKFNCYIHSSIPANDSAVSVGQAAIAAHVG